MYVKAYFVVMNSDLFVNGIFFVPFVCKLERVIDVYGIFLTVSGSTAKQAGQFFFLHLFFFCRSASASFSCPTEHDALYTAHGVNLRISVIQLFSYSEYACLCRAQYILAII
jgi:hypothetical protein